MVALLGPSNILYQHAIYSLHHCVPNSWFTKLRSHCLQYSLPDLLQTLLCPPPKRKFKTDVKTDVKTPIVRYWRATLIIQAELLTSLRYMKLPFLPLGRGVHPVWWTWASYPSAVRAATKQAKMLSGRYRSCWLRRHWTKETGACRLPGCGMVPGDTAHLLSAECPALQPYLAFTYHHLLDMLSPHPHLLPPMLAALNKDREAVTVFNLDPSTDPLVIELAQCYGKVCVLLPLFQVCRAWIWSAHRSRMKLLGLERFLV